MSAASSVASELESVTRSIGSKADKYKRLSRRSVLALTTSTAIIPVLLLSTATADGWVELWVGRILPATVAAGASILSAWIQLERPHERWSLYRSYQRRLEAEGLVYRYRSDLYADLDDQGADRLLAMRLAQLQVDLHSDWDRLVPSSDAAALTGRIQ